MGRIIFYEDRSFKGRSYESSTDCSDIQMHLNRCNSCRVENGCFVVYDRPNYMGNQVFLRRGEYSDYQRMMGGMNMGMMENLRSCRGVPMHRGQFKIRIFERENFGGQAHELMEDCESLQDRYYISDCQSCNVTDGHWLMFEQPNYSGRMIYVRPGDYRNLRDMGSMTRISSIRRIMDMY